MTAVIDFSTSYNGDKGTHWVKLAPSIAESEKVSTWHRLERLRPPETQDITVINSPSYQAMKARWEIIEPAFKAWSEGSEIPDNGTPLGAWAALSSEQAEIFRAMKIRTVEDVAGMKDADIQKIPLPNARQLKGLAADFLANKDTVEAQKKVADLEEKMAAMQAAMDAMSKPQKQPKKQGEAA